jgi:guanylate kinase
VHKYYYGTPRQPLEQTLLSGGVVLLDVDVKGAFKLKKEYPMAASIFILPPSRKELARRLKQRGTEDDKHLRIRLDRAIGEMKLYRKFDYVVINQDLETAVSEVEMIIHSYHCQQRFIDHRRISGLLRKSS